MTRYPKGGRGRKWTIAELKAIPEAWEGDTVADGDGLSGQVRVAKDRAVSIRFRYAFKWDGKTAWHSCGTWPARSLEDIRASRDAARTVVSQGMHPGEKKKADRAESRAQVEAQVEAEKAAHAARRTFKDMYTTWLESGVRRSDENAEIKRSFEKDVLPKLADIEVRRLAEQDVRGVLLKIATRKRMRMMMRVHHDLVQLFNWAQRRQPWRTLLIEGNPMDLIDPQSVAGPKVDLRSQRTRVLTSDEIRELTLKLEKLRTEYAAVPAGAKYSGTRALPAPTEFAIWICLSTACRIGELLQAKWEHLDLEKGTWFIPKENAKGAAGAKDDRTIYLSTFALEEFKALQSDQAARTEGGLTAWCFPNRDKTGHLDLKAVSKQIGDRQISTKKRKDLAGRKNDDSLKLEKGSKSAWTPHDLRRTAATMMQGLGVPLDVIDRCQGHVLAGSKVRRHYLHHDYADEQKAAWAKLGSSLATISPRRLSGTMHSEGRVK